METIIRSLEDNYKSGGGEIDSKSGGPESVRHKSEMDMSSSGYHTEVFTNIQFVKSTCFNVNKYMMYLGRNISCICVQI